MIKTHILKDTVEFTYKDAIFTVLDKSLFGSLWPKRMLEEISTKLQSRYKELSNEEKPLSFFEELLIDVMEIMIEEKLNENFKKESSKISAFLVYHVRTLRSIRRLIKSDREAGAYIDSELYNVQNITISDLYDILDSITKKNRNNE